MTTIQELEKQLAILKKEKEKVQKQIKRDKQKKTTISSVLRQNC